MIKINKNLKDVPATLDSDLTQQRRNELIDAEEYKNEGVYNSRYKMKDIKAKLKDIYHSKCAFCEQKSEAFHVEHFRPKDIYYWLAYSWDNLLYSCPTCNTKKGAKFRTLKNRAEYDADFLEKIHEIAQEYDDLEASQFIHPELENIEKELVFDKTGKISSKNDRVQYTIDTCKLNREDLRVHFRKKILDDIKRKIKDRFTKFQTTKNQEELVKIKGLIEDFEKDAQNPESSFLAFRRYVIEHFLGK